MPALETRVPPPLVTLAVGAAMGGVSLLSPPSPLPTAVRLVAAGLLLAAAARFGGPALASFARARTTVNPITVDRASTLVTDGVYARTRNPMYVGLALVCGAWAAWLGKPLPVLGPVALVAYLTCFQILPEERALTALFGEPYRAYQASTPRWL